MLPQTIEIPHQIYSIDGKRFVKVDLNQMTIPSDQRGEVKFKLNEKLTRFSPSMKRMATVVLLNALDGKKKTTTVAMWISQISMFGEYIASVSGESEIKQLPLAIYLQYCSLKHTSQQKGLRSFILHWIAADLPGIQEELATYLLTTSPPKPKGVIEIQNSSPHERPLSMNQTRALLAEIDSLYIDGKFDPQTNLLWRLLISEALRPSQLNLLQFGDVVIERDADGVMVFMTLLVPIVKQAGTSARDFIQEHRLSKTVAQAMLDHLQFAKFVHGSAPPKNWPLLGVSRTHPSHPNKLRELSKKVLPVTSLIETSRKQISAKNALFDEGDLFSRRFKHTKLTHLAASGASLDVLAYAGYQTSTASLKHYVNLTEEAFAEYESQMQESHSEIENAFRGSLVKRADATHNDFEHQILDLDMEDAVGACSATPCEVLACIGCYICPRFEAFVDGSHDRVEAFLMAERERNSKLGMPAPTVQLRDHILSSVRNIISRIQEQS